MNAWIKLLSLLVLCSACVKNDIGYLLEEDGPKDEFYTGMLTGKTFILLSIKTGTGIDLMNTGNYPACINDDELSFMKGGELLFEYHSTCAGQSAVRFKDAWGISLHGNKRINDSLRLGNGLDGNTGNFSGTRFKINEAYRKKADGKVVLRLEQTIDKGQVIRTYLSV